MAFGALVKNTAGNILVSSDVTCVHRVGRATFESTYLSGLTNFPGYAKDDAQTTLSGRHLHRYSITAPAAPLFFIRPVNYDNFHGVLNQYQSGGKWYVDIIQSGLISQAPEVYAFSKPSNAFVTDESYGFMTRLANGNIAFDSRQRPLAVYAAESVIPPEIPCDGGQPYTSGGYAWNDNTLDWDFTSDDTYNTYDMPSTIDKENLMFSAPSVAQAVYSRQKNGYKFSSGDYGGGQAHYSAANWWAMYHQQYKLTSNAIHAGWGPYAAGYSFSSTWDSGGWFDGGGGSITTGSRPFDDATINLSSNVIIVADARPYL